MYSTVYRTMRLFWRGGLETRRHLQELERSQWLCREELEALQLARIQRLVKYAFEHVPYYSRLYQILDIHPKDIKSLKDFQALPFLTKEDVNNHLDALVSPDLLDKAQPNATGGSTGEPMRFFVEDSFWRWNAAVEIRGRGWYGVREGEKTAWVWGALRDLGDWNWRGRLRTTIRQYRYLNAFSMTRARMQEFAEMLVRWQPVVIRAYASALSLFAEYVREQQITGIRPQLIEIRSEKLTELQRELLEEVFQCNVADVYGAREVAVIVYQCEVGGRHVCEPRYLELVNGDQVVQPGRLGEVVVTSLNQFAMPFIRYRVNDTAIYDSSPCSCGRGLPVLREIVGRKHDFLVTADGQFVHPEFVDEFLSSRPGIARYQVYQPDKNHLEVRLVCRQEVDPAMIDNIRSELQARFGPGMQISPQIVDHIELTPAGKHRPVISEVGPDFGC